jgi:hypothetical protein
MGQLVFQATLGGQVNLVGPNTASTFNINVPATAGNMVTTGDTGTVTNTMLASNVYTAPGTIGSGTANTGAFTTLTTSSTVTHNGGTANGVTYLNGSKVLTSGSALTFDGTGLTNSQNTNQGVYVINRNVSTGASAANLFVSDTTAAFTSYVAYGSRGSGYTTSGMLEASSGGMYSVGLTNGINIMTLDGYPVKFGVNNTERMRLDTSGNLGINNTNTDGFKFKVLDGAGNLARFTNGATQTLDVVLDSSGVIFQNANNGYIAFKGSSSERMRLDSSGNLLVGKTSVLNTISGFSASGNGTVIVHTNASSFSQPLLLNREDTDGDILVFRRANSTVGSVSVTSGATAYNTSSDYRLKNTVTPMTGALAKVALLKPVTYKWNANGSDGEGFIAHELAEVCPDAVTGKKDEIDKDGKPKYQGIDVSFLVATLTAAIQEQQTLITQLQADVAALKGN